MAGRALLKAINLGGACQNTRRGPGGSRNPGQFPSSLPSSSESGPLLTGTNSAALREPSSWFSGALQQSPRGCVILLQYSQLRPELRLICRPHAPGAANGRPERLFLRRMLLAPRQIAKSISSTFQALARQGPPPGESDADYGSA